MKKRLKGEELPIEESEKETGVIAKAKVGRSRSERIDRQFSSHEEAVAYMRQNQTSFLQDVSNNLEFAKKYLVSKSLPLQVPEEKAGLFSNLFDLLITDKVHGGYGLEHDSFEALAARFIWHIEEMLDQELDQITRLEHAVSFGHVTTLWDHYEKTRPPQRQVAKNKRASEIDEIIEKLAKRDAPAKTLWDEFFGFLDSDGFEPKESDGKYTFKKDGKNRKMTFATFSNKLSKFR